MTEKYPAVFETGDIVFTCVGSSLFREVSAASRCWSNHVGIITGYHGDDYSVAESRIPFSGITTLSAFIQRSAGQRYAVRRLQGGLTVEQKLAVMQQVPARLHKLYHTGFNYDSSRQFCSKFVFDIYREALGVQVGSVETFGHLLKNNPGAGLLFWRFWFLGSIPWERRTVTPASLWLHPELERVYDSPAMAG
ncbi:YebB family permuted papain-like enzyme [Salmonella enterica]|nr:YebB family permuted papain-like enzyme [Salmonella enterica]EDW2958375.1 YebB family permuted papain-like enzyme [Salmonella enterica]EIB6307219.1 YebB family permuted papain-like enzyme [Salmonella enterica]ELI0427659.1 YebB family permuted papain-like enzyme [Salmonella enterica]